MSYGRHRRRPAISRNINKLLAVVGTAGFVGSVATLSHNYLQTIQEGMSETTQQAAALCAGSLVMLAYAARDSRPKEPTWSTSDAESLSILPIYTRHEPHLPIYMSDEHIPANQAPAEEPVARAVPRYDRIIARPAHQGSPVPALAS